MSSTIWLFNIYIIYSYGNSIINGDFNGKSSVNVNGPFSIAMLNNQNVKINSTTNDKDLVFEPPIPNKQHLISSVHRMIFPMRWTSSKKCVKPPMRYININKKHRNAPKQTLMASRKSRLSSSQENPGNCSALQRWVPVPQILSCAAHLWDPFQQLPGLYNSATAPYVSERSADQTSTFQSCTWKHRIHPWSLVAWHNWSPSFQQQESAVRSINKGHVVSIDNGLWFIQNRSPHRFNRFTIQGWICHCEWSW